MDNKGTPTRTVSNTSITLSSPETAPANPSSKNSNKNRKKREKRKAKKQLAKLQGIPYYSSEASSSLDSLGGLVQHQHTESDTEEEERREMHEESSKPIVPQEIKPTASFENPKNDDSISTIPQPTQEESPQSPSDSTTSTSGEEQKEPVARKSFSLETRPNIPLPETGGSSNIESSTTTTSTTPSSSSSSTTTSSSTTSTASTPNVSKKSTKRKPRRLPADPVELKKVLEEEANLLEEERKIREMEEKLELEARTLETEIAAQAHAPKEPSTTPSLTATAPASTFRSTSPSKERGENLVGKQRSVVEDDSSMDVVVRDRSVSFATSVDFDKRKKKPKDKEIKEKKNNISAKDRKLTESIESVLDLKQEKEGKKRSRSDSNENAEETAKKVSKKPHKDIVTIRQMLSGLTREQLTEIMLEYVFDEKDQTKYERFLKDLAKKSKHASTGTGPTANARLNAALMPLSDGKPFCILVPYKIKITGESVETEQQCVLFKGKDCSIHMLSSFDDVNWTHSNIHAIIQKNKDISAAGDPVAYFKKSAKGSELTLFVTYRGNDECIHQLRGKTGNPGEISWSHKNLTKAILKTKKVLESKSDTPQPFQTTEESSKKITITPADLNGRKLTKKATLSDINQVTKPPSSTPNMEEQEKRRTSIAKEVHQTELHYVEALRAVMKVFVNPLYENRVIPPEKVNKIFGGVERLITYHENFFKAMTERVNNWSPTQLFGDLFVKEADFLVTYSNYVNNYNGAIETLKKELSENSQFHAFIKKAEQDPLCNMQDIESFLIQPIQRIPRYRLLLEDLKKHTDPTHPDFEDLNKSVTKIKAITKYINEQKRAVENALIVEKIQATLTGKPVELRGRHFIREGPLEVQLQSSKAKPQQKFFFLFNNLMLMCEEKKKKNKDMSQYSVEYIVPFDKILLSNAVENNQVFNLVTEDNKLYITSALTAKDKDNWVKAILDAIESTQEAEAMKKFTQLSKEISESVITKPIKGTLANQDLTMRRKSVAVQSVFSDSKST